MELSLTYIISQLFIIINYVFLIITYQLKDRNKIIVYNMMSLICTGISFILLSAYSGFYMNFVAMLRNIIFLIDERKNGKRNTIIKKDIIILLVLYLISIICAIYTYDGILSLMPALSTMIYTYSVWQKNTKVYKWLGPLVSIIWIIYNIYIESIFGIFLELILMISAIIGLIKDRFDK